MSKPFPKRSPVRERSLRHAGQSLDEQLNLLFESEVVIPVMVAFATALLAMNEWVATLTNAERHPWAYTILAILVTAYVGVRIARVRPRVRQLRLGSEGEKNVAETLEALKQGGAAVLHDIPGDGFNLDHVVVSRHGVFVIETKTHSKIMGKNPKVVFDGQQITVDGMKPDRNPVEQARGLARWLSRMLFDATGKHFPVKPVVVFPGWFVEPMPRGADVWVLNPKALLTFVKNEPEIIPDQDVHWATFILSRYIRSLPEG